MKGRPGLRPLSSERLMGVGKKPQSLGGCRAGKGGVRLRHAHPPTQGQVSWGWGRKLSAEALRPDGNPRARKEGCSAW